MMAYQGGPASIPECVFPAIWRPSVIQGLNSQSRGVVWSLCSGPGELGAILCGSEVFTYPQWVTTKGLTDLLDLSAGASCCVLDLFPCKVPRCSTAVEWKPSPFVWPPPPCSCCVCASALLSVDFVRLGLSHVLSLPLTSGLSKWDFLLGSTLFFCKVNLFTASVNSACSWMLFVSACFSLIL